jgi:uncharacterized protein (TIGR03067 family)
MVNMRFVGATLLGLFLAGSGNGDGAHNEGEGLPGKWKVAKNELKLLQGFWRVLRRELGGWAYPADELQDLRVVISGHKFTTKFNARESEYDITLDPRQRPAKIDLYFEKEKPPIAGIYKLENDRLTICWHVSSEQKRPRAFISSKEAETGLLVLRRERK